MPKGWKNFPGTPPMKATGKNTATMVAVVVTTAKPISREPSQAAW